MRPISESILNSLKLKEHKVRLKIASNVPSNEGVRQFLEEEEVWF